MFYVWLILIGIVSGGLGGMGMGGGTLLIPLLTILFDFNQKIAQGINLIAFSIMSVIVILIHMKNKLIDFKVAIKFASLSLISSVVGAMLASIVHISFLKTVFGLLLVLIAIYQAILIIREQKNKNATKIIKNELNTKKRTN